MMAEDESRYTARWYGDIIANDTKELTENI